LDTPSYVMKHISEVKAILRNLNKKIRPSVCNVWEVPSENGDWSLAICSSPHMRGLPTSATTKSVD